MTPLLPADALRNHVAVLGKTGSGKTSTAKRLVEEVVASGARVCVLDPLKSDWRGLVTSADGQSPGLPFVILGGDYGALPLSPSAGAALGAMVGRGALPLSILDMAYFGAGGAQRFFAAFAEALFRAMTGVVWLVVEEAHEFAPKERAGLPDENMALHWAKKLASAGRSKGIRLLVSSQRLQKLHNDFWGSAETLFVHRLTTPADQEAVVKWAKANAGKAQAVAMGADLARMKTGTAWIMSGEAGIFEKRAIPKFETFDNAATPDGAPEAAAVATARVDVEGLKAVLAASLAEAEANDPKALRARVADLEKALAEKAPGALSPDAIARAQAQTDAAIQAALHEAFEQAAAAMEKADAEVSALLQDAARSIASSYGEAVRSAVPSSAQRDVTAGGAATLLDAMTRKRHAPVFAVARETAPNIALKTPSRDVPIMPFEERRPVALAATPGATPRRSAPEGAPPVRVLKALAYWAALGKPAPTRAMVAAVAGYRPGGGNFGNILGALRGDGKIDYPAPGRVTLTPAGRAACAGLAVPSGGARDLVAGILTTPQRRVFDALAATGETTRDALAAAAGYEAGSGNFGNLVGQLVTLEFVEKAGPGRVRLAEWLR